MELSKNSKLTSGFTIYWRIENFSSELNKNINFLSPVFDIKQLKSQWRLEIYQEKEHWCIYLMNESPLDISLSYSISLLTGLGWKPLYIEEKKVFNLTYGWGCDISSFEELLENEWNYLPNGCITLSFCVWNDHIRDTNSQCVIISRLRNNELQHRPIETFSNLRPTDMLCFPPSYEFITHGISYIGSQKYKAQFKQTDEKEVKTKSTQTDTNLDLETTELLRKLFNEKEYSFVSLRALCKDFIVHKDVLCAKSPVFNAMFKQKKGENNNSVVDSDNLASLMKALHFEPIGDLTWDAIVELYSAADKYQINSLKKECVCLIRKGLSVANVCDVFVLADIHHDKDLMSCAHEYLFENSKAILSSQQWSEFMRHTELAVDVLCKLAKKM